MRVAVFSTKKYDERFLDAANSGRHLLDFLEPRLDPKTAPLAAGYEAVCAFVNDRLDRDVLERIAAGGTRFVALRSAGFNHVDVEAAAEIGLGVARVPAYSPTSVAEHTVALILGLDRKIHRAHARVREGNFALEGLLGFDLKGRTVGIIGTGMIGVEVARILAGFGCRLLGHDIHENPTAVALGVEYVPLDDLFQHSDVITCTHPSTSTRSISSTAPPWRG